MERRVIKGKAIYVYTSQQEVGGGGSRNCMDWIMDAQWAGADGAIIEMPQASLALRKKVQKYADKISVRLGGFPVEVVEEYKD